MGEQTPGSPFGRAVTEGDLMDSRKTVNGAYRYRYAPFRNGAHPLALPLGELSPKVTERAVVKQRMERIGIDTLHFSCQHGEQPLGSPFGRAVTEGGLMGGRKTVNGAYQSDTLHFSCQHGEQPLGSPFGRAVTAGDLMGGRKTVNGAYRHRYAPFRNGADPLGSPFGRAVTEGDLMDSRKTVNGAYRYRYAPFLMPT